METAYYQSSSYGIITRLAQPVIPPHVEYSLTDCGLALNPVLAAMKEWASIYNV